MEKWITTRDAASLAGTSQDYIRALVRDGKINGKKFGSTWMVERKSLEQYYDRSWKNNTPQRD